MHSSTLKRIRSLLWIYFWILIFEGALRKWILPSLSNPLLVIRDPIALYALIIGWPLLSKRPWIAWIQPLIWIGSAGLVLAITVGHGDIFVALYGARILFFHLPLIFLYGCVFDRSDVIKFGWAILLISIPMTVLLVAQSNAPNTHILNVAPGGEGTAAFQGALGRSRPAGTFSFITGVVSFYSSAAAMLLSILYGTNPSFYGRIIASLAGVCLVVALPVSISRSLLAGYLMVFATLLIGLLVAKIPIGRFVSGILALVAAIYFGTMIPAFQATSEAFVARWEGAGEAMGSDRASQGDIGVASDQIAGRVLPGYLRPLATLDHAPLLGYGLGLGTNVGAQRFGAKSFLLGEGSWESTLGELGPLLGLSFLFWRVSLAFWIFRLSLKAALKKDIVPILLVGSCFIAIVDGQISQPTFLGFVALLAGLNLAALNNGYHKKYD